LKGEEEKELQIEEKGELCKGIASLSESHRKKQEAVSTKKGER